MKKLLLSLAIAVGAVLAQAQTFSNHTYSSTIPSSTAVASSSGTSTTLTLSGFGFTTGFQDAAWSFDFTAPTNRAYSAVTFEIDGSVTDGSLEIIGSENVYDTSGGTANIILQGVMDATVTTAQTQTLSYSVSKTFALNPNIKVGGNVSKDILFIFTPNSSGSSATAVTIKQIFTPVPEPTTVAGLVLGLGAIAARRRRK